MKVIQLSDLHLRVPEQNRFGANQHDRLRAAIASINAAHSDAVACILTGDLADGGDRESYQALRSALEMLSVPYRLLPGNHDRRDELLSVFPATPLTPGGFIQSILDQREARLICLDTVAPGKVNGAFDADRLVWLNEAIAGAGNRPVLVFMHHPPVAIGIPMLDPIALSDPGPFLAHLRRHGPTSHLFFGHVHRSVHGSAAGIPFSAQRGLSAQFELDLKAQSEIVEAAPPTYGVILVQDGSVVVHEESFLVAWPRYHLQTGDRVDAAPA